ncbi:DUF1826 domain-containing protein [Pedobacter sp. ASV12]|uniref:DUF1826 domain-containing protein n=1 Tax=Pedobacter sp. ASV12 TaxID=2795120 RepID=UPI0018EB5564
MNSKFANSSQVGVVSSFEALIDMEFRGSINAICWPRDLTGDFKEVASKLQLKENVTEITVEELLSLTLSAEGAMARITILEDLKFLGALGLSPVLNLLKSYERDEAFDFISTDVYSYHVDRSPVATDTFLCTYYGAASDILPNDQVEQQILIPEIRQKLLDLFDGPDGGFESFLKEYFFDLHYRPKPHATPLNLGLGHLWKLAVDHPEQQVLPCVHRAPQENEGEYRLLLIC